ncbi:MAG: MarR family transcriptional regulator [Hyphomicrobiaceae bacterium]|nr:MAG: MarR family transcriptional regulator [Hyphomicrobiaceae bacterium]
MPPEADKKTATDDLDVRLVRTARDETGPADAPDSTSEQPRADVGPLSRMIGYALRRAQLAVFDEVIANFAEIDLRPAQFSVLVLLNHRPGLKQSDVAAALGIQRANFVVLFDGLERRGLARRTPAPNDRRSYALFLTDAGKAMLGRASELEAKHEARLDALLGEGGRERLLELLERVAKLR